MCTFYRIFFWENIRFLMSQQDGRDYTLVTRQQYYPNWGMSGRIHSIICNIKVLHFILLETRKTRMLSLSRSSKRVVLKIYTPNQAVRKSSYFSIFDTHLCSQKFPSKNECTYSNQTQVKVEIDHVPTGNISQNILLDFNVILSSNTFYDPLQLPF